MTRLTIAGGGGNGGACSTSSKRAVWLRRLSSSGKAMWRWQRLLSRVVEKVGVGLVENLVALAIALRAIAMLALAVVTVAVLTLHAAIAVFLSCKMRRKWLTECLA